MANESLKDEYEHYEKMFPSLVAAFDWVFSKDYLESNFVKNSLKKDYGINTDFSINFIEDEDGVEEIRETINASRADTIGEIYTYAAEYDLPTHLIDQAYEVAIKS